MTHFIAAAAITLVIIAATGGLIEIAGRAAAQAEDDINADWGQW